MNTVLPSWMDQTQGIDFTPEKELIRDLEEWATEKGWEVSDGSSLPSEQRQRTDVLLSEPGGQRHMRIAVLPKAKGRPGAMRIDATSYRPFSLRVFDLVYQPRWRRWRVEVATVPLTKDLQKEGWDWLKKFAFEQ